MSLVSEEALPPHPHPRSSIAQPGGEAAGPCVNKHRGAAPLSPLLPSGQWVAELTVAVEEGACSL